MPKYPNAPLVETIFEIRYNYCLSVETERHKFGELIKKDFPELYLPYTKPDIPPGLQPYKFQNSETKEIILNSIVRFSYIHQDYPGYEIFKKRALELINLFCKTYDITMITGTGFRCINHIPIKRTETKILPISKYILCNCELTPKHVVSDINNISLNIQMPLGEGTLHFVLKNQEIEGLDSEVLVIDFDYIMEGQFKISEIESNLDISHDVNKQLFYNMITDTYCKYIKGEEDVDLSQ